MKNRLWLTLVGGVVLVMLTSMSTTGALWRGEATVSAGTVTTGSLVLLVGGEPAPYTFSALSTGNLTPGQAVRAPLAVSNGGSTAMTYGLSSVATSAVTAADEALAASLRLTVTDDEACDRPQTQDPGFPFQAALDASATFSGRDLTPSAYETLCIEIGLDAEAPTAAASGSTAVTFTFRGEQKL